MTSALRVNQISAESGELISIPVGNQLYAPGSILQVQVASSGPARQTVSSVDPVAVDGLSILFSPMYATSRIVVQAQISTSATYVSSYAVYKNNQPTTSTAGFTNTDQPNMNFTTYINTTSSDSLWCWPLSWSEPAANITPRTYTIYTTSGWSGVAYTTYINNRASNDMASFSYMTVTEIAQ